MRTIQGVIDAWDKAHESAKTSCKGKDVDPVTRSGLVLLHLYNLIEDVRPLRDLITIYGNPNKPKPQGVIEARAAK